jgi:hypothetical protein
VWQRAVVTLLLLGIIIARGPSASSASAASAEMETFRKYNLDYLDIETLSYYLNDDTAESFDVAVMFYAQRDQNCHTFAPIWQQIAKLLKAGTSESNLIFGLFDCEADEASIDLCVKARVKTFPGLAYITLAANHTLATKKPKRIVYYPASNWSLGEPVLDWVRAMHGLSMWHRRGWGQRLHNALFFGTGWWGRDKKSKRNTPVPLTVGPPPALKYESKLLAAQRLVAEEKAHTERSAEFIDATLFPLTMPGTPPEAMRNETEMNGGGKNYTDVFAYLQYRAGWDAKTVLATILRTCVAEVSLDYCTRCSNKFTEDWAARLPLSHKISNADVEAFKVDLELFLNTTEPYCGTMDDCVAVNFTKPFCRPAQCPFSDATACRYLTTCLSEVLQAEYAEAMNLLDTTTKKASSSNNAGGTATAFKKP